MQDLDDDIKLSFESTLVEQLDQREVGGSGFARGNEILEKAVALLRKVSQVSSTAQVSPAVLVPPPCDDPVEFGNGGVCVLDNEEEDIVLTLSKPEHMAPNKRARIIKELMKQQLASLKIKVGCHHGHFNLLSESWKLPKGLTVIQLVNLWLVGSKKEHAQPLRRLSSLRMNHANAAQETHSKTIRVIGEIE